MFSVPVVTVPMLEVPLLLFSGYLSYRVQVPPAGYQAPPGDCNKRDAAEFYTRNKSIFAVIPRFMGVRLMRISAYPTLGRLFVGEVVLKKKHKLVTTGMYAYVRHPSYTGWGMLMLGHSVALTTPGSFLAAIDVWSSTLGTIVALMLDEAGGRNVAAGVGTEWEEWAKRTPYRLVPYVCRKRLSKLNFSPRSRQTGQNVLASNSVYWYIYRDALSHYPTQTG
ncbi:hypothetical protein BD309DRAFT_1069948 [Dichomitus squalens]|nr:hypothetical protein BD309DRAFT_1069948 [Dichomitus squalens]